MLDYTQKGDVEMHFQNITHGEDARQFLKKNTSFEKHPISGKRGEFLPISIIKDTSHLKSPIWPTLYRMIIILYSILNQN